MQAIGNEERAEIEARLKRVCRDEQVRLLLAIESGSRAWGFPSPDSDYDVRFIFVRPWRDYVSLRPRRDVIERPIVDDFDVNGWDIRKTLRLMLNHNAVVAEWLDSPIRYEADAPVVGRLRELVDRFFNPGGYARHYASVCRGSLAKWGDSASVPIKPVFYALRPALCLRALRCDPDRRPPMQLQALMAISDLPSGLIAEIDDLVGLKAKARETAAVPRSARIGQLVTDELARAGEIPDRRDDQRYAVAADTLLLELLSEGR